METRPVLIIPRTRIERGHDVLSMIAMVGIALYLLLEWSDLAGRIPIHFNAEGEADGWGGRGALVPLPIITLVFFAGLTILSKYPHKFNYLVAITKENARKQYILARLLISWMKLEVVLLFGYLEWAMIQSALHQKSGIGMWMLPAILVIVLGTIIIGMVCSIRLK